jgi:hypothetical protein
MRALQRLLGAGLIVALALTVAGCHRKKADAPPPADEPKGNPLRPDPAGGAPAQGAVQRGAQRVVNQELLRNFGQYYAAFKTDNTDGRPPRTVQEFRAYLAQDPNARNLVGAIDKDWVVFRLDPPPNGSQVLAYEKDDFKLWHNRLVLFADGSVRMMVQDEFEQAMKQ